MVCSKKELGLSDEHEGILVLDDLAPVGAPLRDWLGDTVIEFEITPNLVHNFSVLGIARDVGAIFDVPVTMPAIVDSARLQTNDATLVTIQDKDLCPRYMGIVFENVTIGPSPDWLARRLTSAGVRPVNNLVDVTNFVMLEIGQPRMRSTGNGSTKDVSWSGGRLQESHLKHSTINVASCHWGRSIADA